MKKLKQTYRERWRRDANIDTANHPKTMFPVLLVAPTSSFIFNRSQLDNGDIFRIDHWHIADQFTSLPRYSPSYGLLSILSFLRDVLGDPEAVKYVDLFAAGVTSTHSCRKELVTLMEDDKALFRMGASDEILTQWVHDHSPRVVGLTCFTSAHHHDVVNAARVVRNAGKLLPTEPIIIVGGLHPTFLDEYFAGHECFDVVVRGEGEITFLELLLSIYQDSPLEEVKGITFKKDGRIIRNPDRPLMTQDEIKTLPWIARDAIPRLNGEEVTSVYGMWHQGLLDGRPKVADFMTSRGCMTKCDQCRHCVSGHVFGKVRRRDNEDLLREMHFLADQGYTIVSDITDQVLYPLRDFEDFCHGMVEEGIGERLAIWTPNGLFLEDIYRLDPAEKKQMVLAGYRDLCFSIEGGPRYVREVLNKPIDVLPVADHLAQFRAIESELQKRVILRGFFMVGGPGCTEEILEESFSFAKNLVDRGLLDQVIPFIACPVPGSEFFQETIDQMRQTALGKNGTDKLRRLLFNGKVEKIPYWCKVLVDGRMNDMYRFFEENYIWARFRYGLPDLHILYGMNTEYVSSMAQRLSNLTPSMSRIV